MPGPLLIRADAQEAIGFGHVARCYALAAAWRDAGGRPLFVMARPDGRVTRWLERRGLEVLPIDVSAGTDSDASALVDAVATHGASAIVVDGYVFSAPYLTAVRRRAPLVVIDDEAVLDRYDADVVVNQNLHASDELYSQRASAARLLLGPRFALIRPEFRKRSSAPRQFSARAETCLVTFGGSDEDNVTARALRVLDSLDGALKVRAVAGAANPNVDQLRADLEAAPDVELLVDVDDMAEHMAWADIAVGSAGSTSWELATMGVPSVLVPLAPNQEPIAAELAKHGAAATATLDTLADTTSALIDDPVRRRAYSDAGRQLVDGEGAGRVVDVIHEVTP